MKTISKKDFVTAAFLIATLGSYAPVASANHDDGAAVIIEWNQLAQRHIAGAPFSQLRQYAMLHVAMADAVVAIEGRYEPFRFDVWAPRGVSSSAAAAQAAHDVLAYLVPGAAATFDAKLADDLAGIPPGAAAGGTRVGKAVAAWVIGWREHDGFADANPQPPDFLASTLPGIWRNTASGPAQFSKLGDVEPFGVLSPTQFLPDPPPQLESAEYAADFAEVKAEGRRPDPFPTTAAGYSSRQRTALLWAGGTASGIPALPGPPVPTPFANVTNAFRIWYNVARDAVQDDGLSLAATARLFALVAAAMHDSVQTSQANKFVYRLWRPETAIDQASVDDNPSTDAEAGWLPLLLTPPYPSHASNMACIGAGAARMLRNVVGERPVTATWYLNEIVTPPDTTPPVVHEQDYASFWALAEEEGDSRIWGGIHFRFEITDSQEACANIADYIFDTKMQQGRFQRFK